MKICQICKGEFTCDAGLLSHMKWKHSGQQKSHVCQLCQKAFRDNFNLIRHVKTHELNGRAFQQKFSFASVEEFLQWKKSIEDSTMTHYVKHRASVARKDGTLVSKFYCFRDGYYKPSGSGARRLKLKGSNKINGPCPSTIESREKDGAVKVIFRADHSGHTSDLGRLRLTSEDKEKLAYHLSLDFPLCEVLNGVHEEESPTTSP